MQTIFLTRSVAQPGRALPSGGRGRRFNSCHSDHINQYVMKFIEGRILTPSATISFPLSCSVQYKNLTQLITRITF
ncbi:hypothetical protein Lche_0749 [Legionella cherrii]|uniref:Uncharacterized protein n=1 Tax=Legionella cherrii TaxID=28084 RepID=A0A0W0SHV5_9GAMM|nr:hypothetical protein Lche_0749 [Legionella cherrii]